MTPAQKAHQTAYNEFIADYVERHGECKATRDEAHEVADWVAQLSREVSGIVARYTTPETAPDDIAYDLTAAMIHTNHDIDGKDEAKYLATCTIAAALEAVG